MFSGSCRVRMARSSPLSSMRDRKSTRLNSSHTVIYTLSLHDALPIYRNARSVQLGVIIGNVDVFRELQGADGAKLAPELDARSEEHTSELQSHSDLHSFPTRRSSDLSKRKKRSARRDHWQRRCFPGVAGCGWREARP